MTDRRMGQGSGESQWMGHVAAAGVGLVYVAAVVRATVWRHDLLDLARSGFVLWPYWVMIGGLVVLGAASVAVVVASRRMPWMPTAASVLLLYGIAESSFTRLDSALPYLGPWQPTLRWGVETISLVTGAMIAASLWGWWPYRWSGRHAARRS